ncbi:FMN-binding protein [Aeromicrobium sp.]|uniref:FMN-binding protein n=1 Tax=Aeromicrobium sp. TaxID=1871063 RepID=UPI002FC6470A
MKLPTHKKFLSATAAASVLLLTAACGGSEEPADATPTTSETSSAAVDDNSSAAVNDGTYEGSGEYANQAGQSKVKVELTLADGKITDVEVTPQATNATSKGFQQKFASGIADEVVGKSLDELNVSKVSGSSLTSIGFNQAIDQIKADATA